MSAPHQLDGAGVSAREGEVLAALGQHLTNAEIADRLYISVRTVESHVSSLLRKLGVADRRALARLAAGDGDSGPPAPGAGADAAAPARASRPLPSPLTPFVGRVAERAALARAVEEHRLVTALGPGGVGKTRLALAVAAEVAGEFEGGVWYVDLVPVTDPHMIAPAVAAAVGLGEQLGRSVEETVAAWLADRRSLLVLDNCEHLVDGVAVLVERLLTRCPGLSVLAASRARLVVPFERPFPVPGLSLPEDVSGDGGDSGDGTGDDGDAVALFLARASAAGTPLTGADARRRVAAVCRALDGVALAIELAASRLPVLGLDGLEAGLADRLRVLTGGSRADERHRSLRATLDWSYALAEPVDRAVLRRAAVFAAPFTAGAAAEVVGEVDADDAYDADDAGGGGEPTPLSPGEVADALARLVDQSLLVVVRSPGETRYRALETVRQYAEDLCDTGERRAVHVRHLGWSLATATALAPEGEVDDGWRAAFDDVADDLRAALAWASAEAGLRPDAHRLATSLAGLAYRRGRAAEAQQRYEEAAALTSDDSAAASALHHAAEVAANRQAGNEALRLHQAAADAARRAGDDARAAWNLALAATLINRCPGIMAEIPPPGTVRRLLREAHALAVGHPEVDAVLFVAEAFEGDNDDVFLEDLAERAAELARRGGDPVVESAALDLVTAAQLARGDTAAAAASARRRTVLLAPLPPMPESAYEVSDAYHMAAETAVASGDIAAARRFARHRAELPSHHEAPHVALARLLVVDALAGEWESVLGNADRYVEGWEAAGRPAVGDLARAAYAVTLVHGLRGDESARARWREIAGTLRSVIDCHGTGGDSFRPLVEAHVLLHRGAFGEAVAALATPPEDWRRWFTGIWRQWYAALWAEAAVLAGRDDVADRLARARFAAIGNPVASALVERAAALASGDRPGLLDAAAALRRAGCRYQWARTLALAGGDAHAEGESALTSLGTTPMSLPPPSVGESDLGL